MSEECKAEIAGEGAEQRLSDEQSRILEGKTWLKKQLDIARKEFDECRRGLPALLAAVAVGDVEESEINAAVLRLARCQRIVDHAPAGLLILGERLHAVRESEARVIRDRERSEQIEEYRALKAEIIRKAECSPEEERRLRSLAGSVRLKYEAEDLLTALQDWQWKKSRDRDGRFGDFVFVR